MFKLLIVVVTVLCFQSAPAAPAVSPPPFQEYVGRSYRFAASVNENPFVYAAADSGGVMGRITGSMYPFLEPEPATVSEVELEDDGGVRIEFATASLGSIRMDIRHDRTRRTINAGEIDALLAMVTEDPAAPRIVAAAGSPLVHFGGSNHAPRGDGVTSFASVEAAEAAGKKACPACFSGVSAIPDLGLELKLGRLTAREVYGAYLPTTHPEKQQAVREAGTWVLAHWPSPLRGYKYDFELVSMGTPNAVACPGGRIFFSEELFDMCESRLELECVLAHEIAHVEMRHGYRDYRKSQQKAGWGAALGALAGAVASNNKSQGAAVGAAVAVAGAQIAMELAHAGYSRDREEECDFFATSYLLAQYGENARAEMARAFRKLDYTTEVQTGEREAFNAFASHPTMSRRVDYVDNVRMVPLDGPRTFVATNEAGEVILRIELQGVSVHEWMGLRPVRRETTASSAVGNAEPVLEYHKDLRCYGFARASNALADAIELKDITFDYGGEKLKFDNKEDTSLAPGQVVSFYIYNEKKSTDGPIALGEQVPEKLEVSMGKSVRAVLVEVGR